ncbi:MAG: L,D-transpeptidase family protein [Sulfuricurvum sp.]|uniref:L,D-transpeptidase family protein n=1 Tax=Sulfuricurvum sp. TaxID=2025608 RepID=UPI0026181DF5|nr:L,D-transpeptidase family protein [Sulfuricurvum sp.]MDD2368917.1 L,D-transpeptidase family protein [Sulfuricurvum sp.]MDD5119111.1 L,D-transpeptidase family protein [Sulfuricurvum sp.]
MLKTIPTLFASFLFLTLHASEQLLVVISPELNSTAASMQRYEKHTLWEKIGEKIPVTLGRSGLGYASDKIPLKNEGDGRSPAGVFSISSTFGYDVRPNGLMPYYHADEKLICIDDVEDPRYNTFAFLDPDNPPKSFEMMRRNDEVYRNGAVIGYNTAGDKGRGSCIFIHLNHSDHRPTSGCTAMEEESLKELLKWLDPNKKPQILQIPMRDCADYQKEFEGIKCE